MSTTTIDNLILTYFALFAFLLPLIIAGAIVEGVLWLKAWHLRRRSRRRVITRPTGTNDSMATWRTHVGNTAHNRNSPTPTPGKATVRITRRGPTR